MKPSQAAKIIGCATSHVRVLIRQGRIVARRIPTENNQHGYRYEITDQEVKRFCKRKPCSQGWPMGKSRKPRSES